MIKYKFDVMKMLADRGYPTSRIRKEKLLSETTMKRIVAGGTVNTSTINALCLMLRCQPSDILEVTPSKEEKVKYF